MPTQPKWPAVMVRMASDTGVSGLQSGNASRPCIRSATRSRRVPSEPPGWKTLKSLLENPLRSSRATARASPRASIMVVEVVGAWVTAQASGAPWAAEGRMRAMSAASARAESLRDVIATSGMAKRLA